MSFATRWSKTPQGNIISSICLPRGDYIHMIEVSARAKRRLKNFKPWHYHMEFCQTTLIPRFNHPCLIVTAFWLLLSVHLSGSSSHSFFLSPHSGNSELCNFQPIPYTITTIYLHTHRHTFSSTSGIGNIWPMGHMRPRKLFGLALQKHLRWIN